jgi:hypothetical protein
MTAPYGLPLYPSLKDAILRGFERFADSNSGDGVVLRKRATKGWEYVMVLHPHLQGTYRW